MNRTSCIILVVVIVGVIALVPACAPDLTVTPGAGGEATGALGQSCTMGTQCISGFCADGVCCDAPCTQPCYACNQPDSAGVCTGIPVGTDECPIAGELCNDMAMCGCGVGQPVKDGVCPGPWETYSPGQCRLTCKTESDCGPMDIVCPPGFNCTISCPGLSSCTGLKVVCPEDTICNIECTGPDSCQNLQVQCSSMGPCLLGCGSALGACQGAKMACGINSCEATCFGMVKPSISMPLGTPCSVQGC